MKRLLGITLTLVLLPVLIQTQSAPKPAAPVDPGPAATKDQQAAFAAAFDKATQAQKDLDLALARRDSARAEMNQTVSATMAEMQLKPSEWIPKVNEKGMLVFERKAKPETATAPKPSPSSPPN